MIKKKILIFHTALATYRVDVFNALNELYDVEVVFLLNNLWYYEMNQDELLSQAKFKISYLLKGPRYRGRMFRFGVYKKIRKVKPDIVFSYEYSLTIQYLIILKQIGLIQQKIGTFVDDSLDISKNIQSKARSIARQKGVKHLNYFVLLSKEVSQFYQDTFFLKENQIIVSPIIQNPERLRQNMDQLKLISEDYIEKYKLSNKKVLLYVGRLVEVKALPLFLNTICTLLQNQKDLLFVFVGNGSELISLQNIVDEKNLKNKVFFVGEYQSAQLHAWYLAASGLVLPSISETFGAVVNEALIFGLPVFCSSLAGVSSWIKPEHGMVFNPFNKIETIDKLNLFFQNIDPVDNIDLSNNKCLMDFSIEKFNNEWYKLE